MRDLVISFDLDYTLINNENGILNSFDYAFEKYNLPKISKDELVKTIGSSLKEAFKKFSSFNSDKLINAFRDYYLRKGIFQLRLYPTVPKLLNKLNKKNFKLGVVTSKKKEMAVKLLKYIDIYHNFDFVIGETDEIKHKTDPKIKKFFNNTFPDYNYLIVGDNISDKNLAIMLESPFIGLLTGSSSRCELEFDEGIPVFIIEDISQLTFEIINKIFK